MIAQSHETEGSGMPFQVEFLPIQSRNNRFESATEQAQFIDYIRFFEPHLLALYPDATQALMDRTLLRLVWDGEAEVEGTRTVRHNTDPFAFAIVITPIQKSDLREKLAHELCHVMQWITGRMKVSNKEGKYRFWKDVECNEDDFPHYSAIPWEREAMLNARTLFEHLLDAST